MLQFLLAIFSLYLLEFSFHGLQKYLPHFLLYILDSYEDFLGHQKFRNIGKLLSSYYDPLELISPLIIQPQLLQFLDLALSKYDSYVMNPPVQVRQLCHRT